MKYTNEYKRAAYKLATTCADVTKLTNDELMAANEEAKELRFYAEMSDDYRVTCREIDEVNDAMFKAYEEMRKRGIF